MSEWYSDLEHDAFASKHVRVVFDDGTVVDGRLAYDQSSGYVRMGSPDLTLKRPDGVIYSGGCIEVFVCGEDERWHLLEGIKHLGLVWDERDWKRTSLDDIEAIDVLVVAGRLYELVSHKPDCDLWQVRVPGEKHTASVSTAMISFALRRKVNVPTKPGYYKDTLGEFWARAAKSTDDGSWRSVEPDALDQPAKSDKYMANLMPLTPVHFVDGEAEEHDGTGPFEGLVQHLMSKTPASDWRAA